MKFNIHISDIIKRKVMLTISNGKVNQNLRMIFKIKKRNLIKQKLSKFEKI